MTNEIRTSRYQQYSSIATIDISILCVTDGFVFIIDKFKRTNPIVRCYLDIRTVFIEQLFGDQKKAFSPKDRPIKKVTRDGGQLTLIGGV